MRIEFLYFIIFYVLWWWGSRFMFFKLLRSYRKEFDSLLRSSLLPLVGDIILFVSVIAIVLFPIANFLEIIYNYFLKITE